jgi:hypothetical protein
MKSGRLPRLSAGSQCIACHLLEIGHTLGEVNVHSHPFCFVSPAMREILQISNTCNI